ncbi:phage minor head protein [uncultured Ruminococcus sp.]|uniref:phage minor head protein n=1 Tax=uncultured Ruminococcus sp. TaxID=165186 RepID=UPI002582D25B|nr:phage minor head protein [uncultured Ruminococcus sp.]
MTPAQKQTTQYELLSEKKVMEQLERSYQKALEDVKDRLRQLDERTDEENRQAVAYQKTFQQGLQKQLERILGKLHSKTYRTVQEYLQDCYLTGHTAVLYELQSDGLRLSLPVPQDKVYQAAVNDTKLVKPLYDSIGEDFAGLKKHITDIVSAGFASGASYGDMANQITGKMIGNYAAMRGGALGRAKLIVRTEGNRIANAARLEAARAAKQQGADLVKQWDSTMDKKTRPHHVQLDGQVRELDEPFEVDGRKAQAPGKFGIASEDINCRCHAYSRPRWAVRAGSDYKYDNQHRALVKISSESYAAYRAGYVQETAGEPDGMVPVPAGNAVAVIPPATKDNGGTGKTYRAEEIGGKALTSGGDGGIIKASGIRVNLQLFANKNIAKMSSVQLEKSIKAWKSKVEEHREKISAPEKFYPDWDSFDERYKLGNIKHWQKEIDNFKTDISRAEEELKKRGDLNG